MKRNLVPSLLACVLVAACAAHQPPHHPFPRDNETATTGTAASTVVVPPVAPETQAPAPEATPTPPPAPPQKPHDTYPVAKPVPGKPGYVYSPYSPEGTGLIDVRGYPPGTQVKDPWNPPKIFLVP